ncbi:hypothetical protein [Bradyrhizobium archetypum]|uniref:hypothetical protein n=1 Tax=Bradyrhizobium archetypum TaxID=2721160 RepID=UPI001F22F2A4|nr:hypothetical protein [Bradyrhizobium archetypum]
MQGIIAAEVRGKPSAGRGLHGGGSGGSVSRGLRSQPLQAGEITFVDALLALEQAALRLQQPLLRALRPETFRLLRLQLLHALLQSIDAALPLRVLARQHIALALLHDLLPLLDALLTLLSTRFDLFLSRRSLARNGRWARPRWRGDARLRMPRDGRSLRWRGAMNLGSRRRNAR